MRTPIDIDVDVRLRRLRALWSVTYPIRSAAARTRARTAGDAYPRVCSARDTVDGETPASRATSCTVGRRTGGCVGCGTARAACPRGLMARSLDGQSRSVPVPCFLDGVVVLGAEVVAVRVGA